MVDFQVKTALGTEYVEVSRHIEVCPHCGVSINPHILTSSYINPYRFDIVYKCPRTSCSRTYIGSFYGSNRKLFIPSAVFPGQPIDKREFDQIIRNISPTFIDIYNEAYQAEQVNLTHICGMGFRKALEFLIKDYVLNIDPEARDKVMDHRTTLNKVITDHINDPRIIETAKRASWIGNDETHYVRKWETKDVSDLKTLIELVIHWISMEQLTKEYLESMN